MKKDEYEIVERSSGYWITDDFGVVNGPYDTVEEAEKDVPSGQLQYPLEFLYANFNQSILQDELSGVNYKNTK